MAFPKDSLVSFCLPSNISPRSRCVVGLDSHSFKKFYDLTNVSSSSNVSFVTENQGAMSETSDCGSFKVTLQT